MSDAAATMVPSPTPQALLNAIDAVHYSAACASARREVKLATWNLRHAKGHVETLSRQSEVPLAQRAQYRRTTRVISALQQQLKNALADEASFPGGDTGRDDYLVPMEPPPDTQTVLEIKRIIHAINLAEQGFFKAWKRAMQAAQASDTAARIDWGGYSADFEVSIELKLPPERAFYATCMDEDILRIQVDHFSVSLVEDSSEKNQNLFFDPENPFFGDHHGHLAHCLIEHSALPLALFPLIESIAVQLKFSDFLTLWQPVPWEVGEEDWHAARLLSSKP